MRRPDNSLIHFVYWIILTAMLVVLVGRDLSRPPAPPGRTIQDTHTNRESQREHPKDEAGKPFWQQATEDPAAATAVFTLVLTVFTAILAVATIGLYRVTRIAADAARDSANALPALERAYIFTEIHPSSALNIEPDINQLLRIGSAGRDVGVTVPIQMMYRIVNHRKTPAIIKTISHDFINFTNFPNEIRYASKNMRQGEAISAGGIFAPPEEQWFVLSTIISIDDARDIRNGKSFLLLYGQVIYDLVFGPDRKTCFCWRYNGQTKVFEQYNREGEDLDRRT